MNTRLQVEHLVTGAVVGVDLPVEMLRIAGGERLSVSQEEVTMEGVALEARVYAEDPRRGFLPATGVIGSYREPLLGVDPPGPPATAAGGSGAKAAPTNGGDAAWPPAHLARLGFDASGVLVDSGVADGTPVGVHYDPLLAKVVVHGPDRGAALAKLGAALDAYVIGGVTTNIPFLRALTRHPKVLAGDLTTTLIGEEYPDGFHGTPLSRGEVDAAVAVAASRFFASHPAATAVAVRVEADGPPGEGATAGPTEVVLHRVAACSGAAADTGGATVTVSADAGDAGAPTTTIADVVERSLGTGVVSIVTATINGTPVTLHRHGHRPFEDVGSVTLATGGGSVALRVRHPAAVEVEAVCERGAADAAAALGGGARGRVLPARCRAWCCLSPWAWGTRWPRGRRCWCWRR
eukprot:TRINITY_DN1664_c0_g1_i8.p1 TRINITY_DN1664_c0_g1~~TRINITY_DN1664_c0_g1_i8.p1  ORF type:complete len:407 (-),score=140.24 TRINITY_DN1664_c0_g1_i8:301-1521(-)